MIYLDHNATSPLLPEVRAAMEPWWAVPCNPSSVHSLGRAAHHAVEQAAEHVAALVGGVVQGVVFSSGATEANHSWFHAMAELGRVSRVAVGSFEHPCVVAASRRCGEVVPIPIGAGGAALLDAVPDTEGTSLMAVNHETGVIQPLQALRARPGWRHVDASAAAGRIELDLGWADAVVVSAHKLGGPMGIGALLVRDAEPFPALLQGGSQQRGRRGGTVPTPLVVGFGEAARLARRDLSARQARWASLREHLLRGVLALGGRPVGEGTVGSVLNVVFPGLPAEALVQALDLRGVAVSAGAACASGSVDASPVLLAMGHPEPSGGLRISLGPHSTEADIAGLLEALEPTLGALRSFLT